MGILDLFRREKRSVRNTGYTSMVLAARQDYISGHSGVGELTATVQSCISLWENALLQADVTGTDLLDRRTLGMVARALALRGEAVLLITDSGLVPASDWDLSTRDGQPRAYRLSIPEVGGNRSVTALAGEVTHFRTGADLTSPWQGTPPLRRARLSAGLLQEIEEVLAAVYADAPIGSSVLPFPEAPDVDMESLARGFRGKRGRVLLRESTNVTAAGGPGPAQDWRANDLTPDLRGAVPIEALEAARASIMSVFGVLPALLSTQAQGAMVREAQRHLVAYTVQPMASLIAEEATAKLGHTVTLECARPLQSFDTGGRARALATIIQALGQAKELGVDVDTALKLVHWEDAA